MENKLVVSVQMITYGHEAYIKQAVEGVLMQETDFDFDLIIADDCSPDKTPEIINEIIKTNPKSYRIKYFRHFENMGMYKNGIFALSKCIGKYIAICEGDDYWTDPYKLQKQVNFLEANKEYTLCFHNAIIYDHYKNEQYPFRNTTKNIYKTKDVILKNWFCPTASILVRKNSISKLIGNKTKIVNGDLLILFLSSLQGSLYCLDETMSVYNYGVPGSMSSKYESKFKLSLYKNKLRFLSYINRETHNKYIIYISAKKIYVILSLLKNFLLKK